MEVREVAVYALVPFALALGIHINFVPKIRRENALKLLNLFHNSLY